MREECSTTEHRLLVGAAAESKAFHLSIKPRTVVVEDLSGPFDVSASSLERLRDRFALDLFDREIRWDNAAELAGLGCVKVFR